MKGKFSALSHKTAVVAPNPPTNVITVQGLKRSHQAAPTPSERSARLTSWFASSHHSIMS